MADDKQRRRDAFDAFYLNIWKERYPSLKEALLKDAAPIPFSDNLKMPYYLDRASIIAASALPLEAGDRILDMCASPGGKTLVLYSRGLGEVTITANDRSQARVQRLKAVIKEHVPEDRQHTIEITCKDGADAALSRRAFYDAVLLDAPCSSERHVLQSEKHLAMWSPSRPKRLAGEQFTLLSAAFEAVKVGGYMLYSTCSINSAEDEKVVAKLFLRREGQVEEIKLDGFEGEEREYGRIILPDKGENLGPLYFALLRKTASHS